jgi:gliding motility-associated-like protein
VYSLPVITLNHDSTICIGNNRVLDAGAGYVTYQWSNGQTGSSITVNTTGVYGVGVTDTHGCIGSDSTRITKMLPLPAGFLPADTSICNYGTIQLNAAGSFNSYNWSNNSISPSITISQPGWYWLQVSDKNNCIGLDSILVNPKECLKGLYVPSGFTPNNDGKNDLFKPILLGNVKAYQFWIFNRWGQIVFQTTDLSKGWNGTFGGLPQDNRVFVWMCRYQLESEPLKMANGTFIIIR